MPQSQKRKSQREVHPDFIPHKKKRKSAVPVAVVFCMLFAAGIAWFAAGASVLSIGIGLLIGGVVGYIAGVQMDKTFKVPD